MTYDSATRSAQTRRGLSFFEFIGCLTALVGGVVLGSMYLGVDVKAMALGVLEQSQLLKAEAPEVAAQPESGSERNESETPAAEETSSNGEQLPTEITDITPKSWKASLNEAIQAQMPAEVSEREQRKLTEAYWRTLATALEKQRKQEANAQRNVNDLQLYDLLTIRKQAHAEALEQMESLDTHGVNQRVVSYSAKLKQWHEDGVALYSRAIQLLTDAAASELTGPFAQSWQSAATQHRMEEKLLREKHSSIELFLSHWQDSELVAPDATIADQPAA